MRRPLIDAIRGLDPAAGAPEPDSEALLARVRDQVRDGADTVEATHRVPRPRSRPARRLALGAAALAVGGVVATVVVTQTDEPAYATWTQTPSLVDARTAAAQCPTDQPGYDTTPVPVEPVLAEERGSYTFIVLAGDGVFAECLVDTADGAVVAQGLPSVDGSSFSMRSAPLLVLDGGAVWPAAGSEGDLTPVVGLAEPGVESVRVLTADGTFADAAVENGWWSVWFPGDVELAGDVVIGTEDGTESTLTLDGMLGPNLDPDHG